MSNKYEQQEAADQWINQIAETSSLTVSDTEELKCHYFDTVDELKTRGLDDAEACEVAKLRLGRHFNFEGEYAQANEDALLMRNIVLILAGIMSYLLLFFTMKVSCQLIVYNFHDFVEPERMRYWLLNYIIGYHLVTVILTFYILIGQKAVLKKTETLNIRPFLIYLFIFFIFTLATAYFMLMQMIKGAVSVEYLSIIKYYYTLGYSCYTFPLVSVVCFFILFRYRTLPWNKRLSRQTGSVKQEYKALGVEEPLTNKFSDQLAELKRAGLEEEEAITVVLKRNGIASGQDGGSEKIEIMPMKSIIMGLSGILAYLFLYYLLNSSTRIFLTVLQYIENNPAKNFGWIKWYIASFDFIIIFFTISVYIQDRNLILELKKFTGKPFRYSILFVTTVVLAYLDYYFLPVSRRSLRNIFELKVQFTMIMLYSDLILLFVLSVCFIVLFNKYYRENIKIY